MGIIFFDWKKIWDKWDVHGVILLSLGLQIFLIFFAASRKRSKGLLRWFIWLAYLLADWAASFCVGLISNHHKIKSTKSRKDYLMAFWSPFLLLHLGGPDTITAFALEDNELWVRHLLGLIFQAGTAAYIFVLTVHQNTLWLPTLMVFLAGLIKYAERTRALYRASFNAFRQSLVPDAGPDYAKLMEEFYSRKAAGLPARIVTIPELEIERADNVAGEERNQEEISDLEAVQRAFFFFQMFKGVIVDMIYSFDDRRKSQQYFKSKTPKQALQVIEIELNFMYEAFYTKVTIARRRLGYLCKFISFISVLLGLGLFILADKHGLDKFDVGVTYALLYGALALDTIAVFMLIFTEYTATLFPAYQEDWSKSSWFQQFKMFLIKRFNEKMLARFLGKKKPRWEKIKSEPYKDCNRLSTSLLYRRWFGAISGYNLMEYCLELSVPRGPNYVNRSFPIAEVIQRVRFKIEQFVLDNLYEAVKRLGFGDLYDQWRFKTKKPFLLELWEFIFNELKKKADDVGDEDAVMIRSMCSSRGEWVIEKELEQKSRERLMPFVDSNEVAFDQSLILWHIATCLCYYSENCKDDHGGAHGRERDFSMLLSDYMLYLLIAQPTMMSTVAGIGQIRFHATCAEAKKFFTKRRKELRRETDMLRKACKDLMELPTEVKSTDVKGERSISLLFDACRLAKELNELKDKWKIIAPVWVELLSFAATQCRPTAHVKVLSEGGELLSLVWLLMIQLGLGKFQFKGANAKLVVG